MLLRESLAKRNCDCQARVSICSRCELAAEATDAAALGQGLPGIAAACKDHGESSPEVQALLPVRGHWPGYKLPNLCCNSGD